MFIYAASHYLKFKKKKRKSDLGYQRKLVVQTRWLWWSPERIIKLFVFNPAVQNNLRLSLQRVIYKDRGGCRGMNGEPTK